jgi:hypothetical protein
VTRKTPAGQGASGDDDPPISYVWLTHNKRPKRASGDSSPLEDGGPRADARAAKAKVQRIVRRAPEVMVKITGRTKGIDHLKSHLEYITRNGDLAAETETGAEMSGRSGLRDLQERWTDDVLLDKRRANGTLSVNMILSMPPGTDGYTVRDAVRAFAIETFEGKHDYAFVLHQDDIHPHVHLTVRSCGHDGRRLNPRKADLHEWRERFAGELRLRGVEAEATPRRSRGKVRKADRGRVRAMKERGVAPVVEQRAREELLREVQGGALARERPWEDKILRRQEAIRRTYLSYAAELGRSSDPSEVLLARQIEEFVRDMPALRTRRHDLRQELAAITAREKGKAIQRGDDEQNTSDRFGDRER